MGRTFRGLSKKDRIKLRETRDARRNRHNHLFEESESDSDVGNNKYKTRNRDKKDNGTTNRKQSRDTTSDLDNDFSEYGY